MDLERWQRLSPLLDVLLELEADARATRVAALRAADPALADELEKLLALEDGNDDFIAQPLLEKPAHSHAGRLIGPYRMDVVLGEGGMGMVWLASRADGLYQRQVALKLLRPGLADPGLRLRFSREREILAKLEHPNIARLLDAGIGSEGQPYLALEYVEGIAITDYCQAHELPVEARLKLFCQVCEAVSHAHTNLIVHRDLKPSNILVTPAGEVRLLDFGIAKLLDDPAQAPTLHPQTEVRAFTLHYAAPEQVRGETVTTRTDVYSLGVVLYEILTGSKPYRLRRQTDAEWEQAILAVQPLKPSVTVARQENSARTRRLARRLSGDLDTLTLKALAKLPEQRYASVEALTQDLSRHLAGRPIQARPQSWTYQLGKFAQRHRLGLVLGSLATLLVFAALATSVWQGRQAVREATRAQAMQNFVIGLFDNAGAAQQGNVLDARKLLAAGERRGDRELAKQPLAHAELLGVIAQLHLGLGDYQQALALIEQQAKLLETLQGAPVELRLDAVTLHGRTLRLLDRSHECLQVMTAGEHLLPRIQSSLSLQQANFLSQQGRCSRLVGERQQARALFEHSLRLRQARKDPLGVAENLYDLALLNADLGHPDDALASYDLALEQLHKHVGVRNALAAEIQASRGYLLRARGDSAAARATFLEALAIAEDVHGKQHPVTLGIRRQLIALQVDQEHYAAAEQQIGPLLRLTLASLGPQHRETAMAWNTRGVIAWERGHLDQARADLARAVAIWRGPEGSQHLPGGLFVQALVLFDADQQDLALQSLRESRKLRAAALGASHAVVGETDRMIGEVLAAQGKIAEATAYFDRAVKLTRIGYGPDDPRSRLASLSMARQQARLGQATYALATLDAMAVRAGEGSEDNKLRWNARMSAAEIRCKLGRREPARRALDTLLRELHQQRPDGGTLTRKATAIRGACG